MHTLREGKAYALCLGRRSLAPQSDAGSYRCLGRRSLAPQSDAGSYRCLGRRSLAPQSDAGSYRCLGRRSLAPQSDAGSYRCLGRRSLAPQSDAGSYRCYVALRCRASGVAILSVVSKVQKAIDQIHRSFRLPTLLAASSHPPQLSWLPPLLAEVWQSNSPDHSCSSKPVA